MMFRLIPILIGLVIIGIIGGIVFLVADQWDAEVYHGTAVVIEHDYNEEYYTYDSNTKTSTYHSEEFILVIQYEDIIASGDVSKYLWKVVADGDKVTIDYWYGNFSSAFYVSITGKGTN